MHYFAQTTFSYFNFQVQILESRNLTHLHVPELRRHEISLKSSNLTDLSIHRGDGGRKALIKYTPKVSELQERLRTNHALQFVLEYDVEREDNAGDIQVRSIDHQLTS